MAKIVPCELRSVIGGTGMPIWHRRQLGGIFKGLPVREAAFEDGQYSISVQKDDL